MKKTKSPFNYMKCTYGFENGQEIEFIVWAVKYLDDLKNLMSKLQPDKYHDDFILQWYLNAKRERTYFNAFFNESLTMGHWDNFKVQIIKSNKIPFEFKEKYMAKLIHKNQNVHSIR